MKIRNGGTIFHFGGTRQVFQGFGKMSRKKKRSENSHSAEYVATKLITELS